MNMASKNLSMEKVDQLIAQVNRKLQQSMGEDEKRYRSYVCGKVDSEGTVRNGCGRSWALTKPAIIVSPNVETTSIHVPKRDSNGILERDEDGKVATIAIRRRQTGCYCGRPFKHPSIHIDELRGTDVKVDIEADSRTDDVVEQVV
jgi:hypothetical protein